MLLALFQLGQLLFETGLGYVCIQNQILLALLILAKARTGNALPRFLA